jgi:hypothetical protein
MASGRGTRRWGVITVVAVVCIVVGVGAFALTAWFVNHKSTSTSGTTEASTPTSLAPGSGPQPFSDADASRLASDLGSGDLGAIRSALFGPTAAAYGNTLTTLVAPGLAVSIDASTWSGAVMNGAGTVQADLGGETWTLALVWDQGAWLVADSVQGTATNQTQ